MTAPVEPASSSPTTTQVPRGLMSEDLPVDILVLGPTGFTGRLVIRYLCAHPRCGSFTFAIAARSKSKLNALVANLGIDDCVPRILVDVTDFAQIEAAVKRTRVVINLVGSYSHLGTPVVRACVRHGRHYVDLSGETLWIKKIIDEFDYYATKTGAIVIPSCGFASMPSDISVYMSNKTAKSIVGPEALIEHSVTAIKVKESTPSGGTVATAISMFEELKPSQIMEVQHVLSPIQSPTPPRRLFYKLTTHSPPITGTFFIMSPANRAIVERTWGLHQVQLRQALPAPEQAKSLAYGPNFVYDEFLVTNNIFLSLLINIVWALLTLCFMTPPIRGLVKRFGVQPGEGPSEEAMMKGQMEIINFTATAATLEAPQIHIKSVMRGKGDPGYSLTAVMISEAALCIVLSHGNLPELGRRGGVLTPVRVRKQDDGWSSEQC